MSKNELLSLLDGIRQGVLLGYLLIQDYEQTGGSLRFLQRIQRKSRVEIKGRSGTHVEPIDRLGHCLADGDKARVVRGNYLLMLDFDLMRLSHECVMMYCDQNKYLAAYQAEDDLYQFARICRNLVSHHDGATLNEWPPNLTKRGTTEVTWRGTTLRQSDVGNQVHIDSRIAFLLHEDLTKLARRLP